jgi:hypothetical protein
MKLCWHCNERVVIVPDGWICFVCGQYGPPFKEPLPVTWEEAMDLNTPYRGKMTVQELINRLQQFNPDANMFATWEGTTQPFDVYEAADGQIVIDADRNQYQCQWQKTKCEVCGQRANGISYKRKPVCYKHWKTFQEAVDG